MQKSAMSHITPVPNSPGLPYWFFFKYVEFFGEATVKTLPKNFHRKVF
jgi:hypothetical protein